MLQFGLDKADAEVDFGLFDNDGPDGISNSGDDDGKVDTVFFIHPEASAECGGTAKNNIWSHSWHYSEPTYGHNGPYVTKDVRRDASGAPRLNPDGTPQRIVVEDYTIQPGLDCGTGPGGIKKIIEVGVFCHEYGHALGLPDLYDRTPSNGPDSEGIGNFCLMAGGSYGTDGNHSESPALMSAWSKAFLGWAQVQRITSNQTVAFEPVADRNVVYCFDVPNTNGKEYFNRIPRQGLDRPDQFQTRAGPVPARFGAGGVALRRPCRRWAAVAVLRLRPRPERLTVASRYAVAFVPPKALAGHPDAV